MISVEVKLTKKEMFNFSMRHNYYSLGGVCSIIISLGALALFVFNINNNQVTNAYKIALICVALLFTVVQPILLYIKAGKQVNNNGSVNKPLVYDFSESGFKISSGEEYVTQTYDDISKIVSTKLSVILYLNRYRAFILPKNCIGDKFDDLKKLLEENVKHASSIKIK